MTVLLEASSVAAKPFAPRHSGCRRPRPKHRCCSARSRSWRFRPLTTTGSSGGEISRDPASEFSFRRATARSIDLDLDNGMETYTFIRNDGLNSMDWLGLFGSIGMGVPGYSAPHCLKKCGSVLSRAIEPADDPDLWDYFHESISGMFAPHVFIILDDGTRLTHGGTATGEDHRTAKGKSIYVDPSKGCDQFYKCMKENWPDDSEYRMISHNCGDAAYSVIRKCGGTTTPGW